VKITSENFEHINIAYSDDNFKSFFRVSYKLP
jgi:glutaredoxin-related protein